MGLVKNKNLLDMYRALGKEAKTQENVTLCYCRKIHQDPDIQKDY